MPLTRIALDEESLLGRQFTLPPLPQVAVKVLDSIASDDASAGEIGELIGTDPALAAEVLKVVNSAYYALAREIRDVKSAVAYLGLAKINNIVMVTSVMQAMAPSDADAKKGFWFHSYYTALASKVVAKHVDDAPSLDELYAAGLLHDVGKLVYLKLFPDHYRELSDYATSNGRFLTDAERHFEQPSHLTLGTLLCDHWRLPDSIKHACEAHELEHLEGDQCAHPVQRVVAIANLLVHLHDSDLEPSLNEQITAAAQGAIGCSEQDFLVLMGEIYDLEQEVCRFLDQM